MSKKHNNKIIKIDPKNEPLNEKVPKQRENPNSFLTGHHHGAFQDVILNMKNGR